VTVPQIDGGEVELLRQPADRSPLRVDRQISPLLLPPLRNLQALPPYDEYHQLFVLACQPDPPEGFSFF